MFINKKTKGKMENKTDKADQPKELMLQESPDRFTFFPVKYPRLWNLYEIHERAIWFSHEIKYEDDISDWNSLDDDERYFIKHILAFFAGADGIVIENLMSNFGSEVQWYEARAFYSVQSFIENVHAQTYAKLIETYITDPDEKHKLFNALEEIPCVKRKGQWAMKWMDPTTASFAQRLVAFAVVEGVFFSGSFCAIFWLKSRGKMQKALGMSNEFIARDEGMHCNFAITLYDHLEHKLDQEVIHEIFDSAMEIEKEFIIESLPCRLLGMNSELMSEYIKYVADYWIIKFGYEPLYNVNENPFDFMILNDLEGKTNFFEKDVSEYQKAKKSSSSSYNSDF